MSDKKEVQDIPLGGDQGFKFNGQIYVRTGRPVDGQAGAEWCAQIGEAGGSSRGIHGLAAVPLATEVFPVAVDVVGYDDGEAA